MLLLHLWNINMVFIQNAANRLRTFKRKPTFKLYVKSKCFTWNFIKYRKFGRLWFHNQIYFQLLLVRGKCWYKKFIIIVGAVNEKYNNKIFQGHSLMDCQLLKNRMFHVKHSVAQRTKIKQTLFVFEFAQNIANPVQIVFIVVIDIYAPLAIVP